MSRSNFTHLSRDEISQILSNFSVGLLLSDYKIVTGGLANTSYKVTTELGHFLLKICDEKSVDELQIQIRALLHFKKHGFVAAYPHALRSDPDAYIYQDEKIRAVVYDFILGLPKQRPEVNETIAAQLGASLAQLHLLPPISGLPGFTIGIDVMLQFLELEATPVSSHPFVALMRQQVVRLETIVSDPSLPQGMMHGDLFPDNALFDGDRLLSIIDWEEVSLGPHVLDVAMAICGCCYPTNDQLDAGLVTAFLDTYSSVRPLLSKELLLLPEFLDYAVFATALWRFRQFNVRNPDEVMKNKHEEIIERLLRGDCDKLRALIVSLTASERLPKP
eukprot:TRINITY_DN1635_c1_g1_i6.p1 TRINITY_DN1635_c1_g1~~TRINITY_DN1635_c1_g1_i6.p1  ORF type:complete len:333 (+),score=62.53 TRINITY_DN1635_c1_g1_i6:2048-3046(+)